METERRSQVLGKIIVNLGEITLALMLADEAVHGSSGKTLLHDDVMSEVIARTLALGAVSAVYDRQQ